MLKEGTKVRDLRARQAPFEYIVVKAKRYKMRKRKAWGTTYKVIACDKAGSPIKGYVVTWRNIDEAIKAGVVSIVHNGLQKAINRIKNK